MNRNWIFIIVSGVIEILWAIRLKHLNSFIDAITVGLLICISFFLLFQATKKVPVATVYAVFTGIGTAGTTLVGMLYFNEAFSWTKIFFISLLLTGILGLKLVTSESEKKGEF